MGAPRIQIVTDLGHNLAFDDLPALDAGRKARLTARDIKLLLAGLLIGLLIGLALT